MSAAESLASFAQWRQARQADVEAALMAWVPADAPAALGEAMRYAVLDGGKRLRPLLALAAAEAVGGSAPLALRAGCAIELIHAYSLVHDDMPCMDNDVLRRGKPTVHVAYGEAQALLVGDALQALAFELLAPDTGEVPDALAALWCRQLAQAAGAQGMAGGQAVDLASVGLALDQAALEAMHRLKTGALLRASVAMGAAMIGPRGGDRPRPRPREARPRASVARSSRFRQVWQGSGCDFVWIVRPKQRHRRNLEVGIPLHVASHAERSPEPGRGPLPIGGSL